MNLGWAPDYSRDKFEQGLQETIEWYKTNTQWVENIWQKKRDEMNKFQHREIERQEKLRRKLGLRTDVPLTLGVAKAGIDPLNQ